MTIVQLKEKTSQEISADNEINKLIVQKEMPSPSSGAFTNTVHKIYMLLRELDLLFYTYKFDEAHLHNKIALNSFEEQVWQHIKNSKED